jgi:subtilisin family serine protease
MKRRLVAVLAVLLLAAGVAMPVVAWGAASTETPDFVPGRVLVGANPSGRVAAQAAIEAQGGRIVSYYAPGNFFIVDTPGAAPAWVQQVRPERAVRFAELDYIVHATDTIPNDPQWGSLWGMQKIGMPAVWDAQRGSANVVVGVVDSGIDFSHEDLAPNVWTNPGEIQGNGIDDDLNGWVDDVHGVNCITDTGGGMDDFGHGTHVAGTIGAVGNNAIGVAGVNWSVRLMALKFLGSSGAGTVANAVKCLDYATSMGADLTNHSWNGGSFSQAMYDAIARARAAGDLMVASAGNSSVDNDRFPASGYPSSYDLDNIIAVAATDQNDNLAFFSNFGATTVDLAAPGVGIVSTIPNNGYTSLNGTSMAAPHVAGAAALLWASRPGVSYSAVRARILQTVDPIPSLQGMVATGGRLSVARAIFPPPAPAGLTATAASLSEIDLSWSDVSGETGYRVERSANGNSGWMQIGATGQNVTAFADTGLPASTTYSYRVVAANTGGDSAPSNVASATTLPNPPSAPTELSATASSSTGIDLSWSQVTGAAGYKVERSADGTGGWSQIATTTQNVTTYQDTGLDASTTYYYRVVATNTGGDSPPSNVASATTLPNPPPAPAGLTAAAVSSSEVDLSWSDVTGETGYGIQRSADGTSGWTEVGTTGQNVTTYADTGLTADTTYYYRVVASNSGGDSVPSNVTSATTVPNPPPQPGSLTAAASSSSEIDLSWSDVSGETVYKVERSANGTSGWSQIGTTGQNVTNYADTGLAAATTYYYRVVATNTGGDSPPSDVASATTKAPPPPAPPPAPTGLTATAVSSSDIDLSWSDVSGETGYRVERSPDGSNGWSAIGSTGQNVTTYVDTGLAAATTYYYRVVATNTGGDSPPSNIASATTLPSPPPAPTGLTAAAASSTRIDLSWTDVAGETGYKVERSANGTSGWSQIGTAGQNVTTYVDTGLAAATTYYYRVVATNTGGDSPPSTVASATTKADSTAPTAPSGLTANGAQSRINLRWTQSTDTGGSGLAGYEIWRAAQASGPFSKIGTTAQTTYTDSNLPRKTAFWYYVIAFDGAGNRSASSNTATARAA